MNVKLYTLILTLTLAATPALQAMHSKGAIFLARRLCQNALPALGTELNRTFNTPKITQSHVLNFPQGYMPFAFGIGFAATTLYDALTREADEGESTEEVVETTEEQKFVSINTLSLYDIPGILEALVGATEEDKLVLAQKISHVIIRYKTPTLIKMLKVADGRSHRTLVQALKNNITWYSLDDISQILKEDSRRHTHELITIALKNNYSYFTNYTIAGFSLYASNTRRKQYVEVLMSVNPGQQQHMLQPILHDIDQYDVLHLLRHVDKSLDHTILTAFTQSKNPNLSYYNRGVDLLHLLERTKSYDQTNLVTTLIKNNDLAIYNSWYFSGFNKYCNEGAKKILAEAVTKEIIENPDKFINTRYNTFDDILATTAELCAPEQHEYITDTLISLSADRWRTSVAFNSASQKWEDRSSFKN